MARRDNKVRRSNPSWRDDKRKKSAEKAWRRREDSKRIKEETVAKEREDALETVRTSALAHITRRVPDSTRKRFPYGDFEDEGDTQRQQVRLHVMLRDDSGRTVKQAITVSERVLLNDPEGVGVRLGRRLVDELELWEREFREDASPKVPKTPVVTPEKYYGHSITDGLDDDNPVKKRAKKISKEGPKCKLCGPEDRETFPDWGPCPHKETK